MQIARLEIKLTTEERVMLPAFKGSTFRGALGHALRDILCIDKMRHCRACRISDSCDYPLLYETDAWFNDGNRSGSMPQPFVLEPPLSEQEVYEAGKEVSFGLVLIGPAIDCLTHFVTAFERVGRDGMGRGRGRVSLSSVTDAFSTNLVYTAKLGYLPSAITTVDTKAILGAPSPFGQNCELNLVTPLRMKAGGQLTRDLPFEQLVRAILRRVIYLEQCFSPHTEPTDYQTQVERSKSIQTVSSQLFWQDWERYSSRQDRRMKLGGLVGRVSYEGELAQFAPLLILGELLHIGKNTTFGLGKYELTWH